MNKSRHSCNRTQHGSIVLPDSLVTQLHRMSILFLLRVKFVSLWIDCSVLTPRGRSMLPLGLLSKGSRGQPEESLSFGSSGGVGEETSSQPAHIKAEQTGCAFFPTDQLLPAFENKAGEWLCRLHWLSCSSPASLAPGSVPSWVI